MARFLCIHGHFYQPPRDDPWLGTIEPQPSAHPYRDWNARIAAECYAPNAAARILDGDGRTAHVVNNYARISFDFGPTLLAWLQAEEPAAYGAVLAADRESRERFSGHGWATLTNYAEYLGGHPPADEVELVENTSWSCVHGVDRWREDCGCRLGGPPDWNQAWRTPLRQALDELRDEIAPLYEQAAGELFDSPWEARDHAIALVLDPSPAGADAFLARHCRAGVPAGERRALALRLLQMQRHAMLMYTSCGWFFDDLAGLESVQVLRYAGRAAQLADELFGSQCERALVRRLAWARSNDPAAGTGRDLYEARVRPAERWA